MSSDTNLELGNLVFTAVSLANQFVEGLDILLDTDSDEITIDRTSLEAIRQVLMTNSTLAAKLFEENQTIGDQVANLLRKYALPKQD